MFSVQTANGRQYSLRMDGTLWMYSPFLSKQRLSVQYESLRRVPTEIFYHNKIKMSTVK